MSVLSVIQSVLKKDHVYMCVGGLVGTIGKQGNDSNTSESYRTHERATRAVPRAQPQGVGNIWMHVGPARQGVYDICVQIT